MLSHPTKEIIMWTNIVQIFLYQNLSDQDSKAKKKLTLLSLKYLTYENIFHCFMLFDT